MVTEQQSIISQINELLRKQAGIRKQVRLDKAEKASQIKKNKGGSK